MILSQRLLSVIIFVVFILGGISLMLFPIYVVPISVSLLGIIIIFLVRFFLSADVGVFERILYIVSLSFFFLSGIVFFTFLERSLWQYVTLFGVAVVAAVYIENAYKFLWKSSDYHFSALSNVSSYMYLLTIFFVTVSVFNLRFFFGISTLVVMIVTTVFGLFLFYAYLWSQKVVPTSSRWFAISFALLFVEMIYILNLWPHIPLVKGVVTLAFVYGMMQMLILSIRDSFQTSKVMRILGIVTFVLVIVLVTAQWK